jgi:ABC-type bacteriocin/lantibiotic exporter with double-glycine peptidase domain
MIRNEQHRQQYDALNLTRDTFSRLSLIIRLERKILAIIIAYALVIGVFSLIVPLTVQELVNTFAFSIEPIMIVTLVGIMAIGLAFIGGFKLLQASSVEILNQRLYTRIALALTQQIPRFREETFMPRYANCFMEAELLPRALLAMLVDLINVVLGGMIGMTLLVMFHPYFIIFNALLVGGFIFMIAFLGRGALKLTLSVSQSNYDTLSWMQDIAHNLLHFKSTASMPLLLKKTDELVTTYVAARKVRADILTWHQYRGVVFWQAFAHSGLIGTAGWLLSSGQLTLGQFVASEVIVGTLLLNLDTMAKRMYAVYYVFASMSELSFLFSLPKDMEQNKMYVSLPDPTIHGVRMTCKDLTFSYPDSQPIFQNFNLEVTPGEKIAIYSKNSTGKTTLACVLAGLYAPTSGVIRYNGVDLRDLDMDSLNTCRGLILDSKLTLFEGTLEENITLGRSSIQYDDVRWALRFVELEDEIDALPLSLRTPVLSRGKNFTTSQILRILVARAIITRPQVLILDGTLHSMQPHIREILLRRLCSKEEPWSVVFVSNDPTLVSHVDRRLVLD